MMTLPGELRAAIEAALGADLDTVEGLGTSFGSQLCRVRAGRAAYALKWSARPLPGALAAEAHGLRTLAAAGALHIPAVIAVADPSDAGESGPAFLLIEWLDGGGARVDMAALGAGLAALHRHSAPAYGLERDNYIGGTPQINAWSADWVEFYRERRLLPQIELAGRNGLLPSSRRRALERLLGRLDDLLAGVARTPSLTHGDLWAGNVLAAGPDGAPALIDPAVHYADRETEIAFSELFGGFRPQFYAAYDEAWPLEPGYAERRPLYQLYHLLNHLNLFGEGYGSQVDAVARRYGG